MIHISFGWLLDLGEGEFKLSSYGDDLLWAGGAFLECLGGDALLYAVVCYIHSPQEAGKRHIHPPGGVMLGEDSVAKPKP